MERSTTSIRTVGALVVGLGLALAGGVGARAQDPTPEIVFDPTPRFPTRVHAGGCDNLAEIAFPLAEAGYGLPVPLDPGAALPAEAATAVVPSPEVNPAAVSATTVTVTLDALLDAEHAVTVHSAAEGSETETQIVCGTVGGYRNGDDLVFGLRERNGSNYGGTAWLHDNRDGTTSVFVFVASGLGDGGAEAAAVPTATPAADGAAPPPVAAETIPEAEGDTAVATDRVAVPDAAPTALAELPDNIEEATLPVAGGVFGVDELVLREDEPTVLHVDNRDERAYRLAIGDLVPAAAIVASAVTDIEFTTPNARVYEGLLVAVEGDRVLDRVRVVVQAPGGVAP